MPMLERARTDEVIVGSFSHEPGELAAAVEWWQEPCLAFTMFGSREVRCRRGAGDVRPGSVLVTESGAEHDCRYPDGADDRMLCVLYLGEGRPGPGCACAAGSGAQLAAQVTGGRAALR
jgi:hypothetical protein